MDEVTQILAQIEQGDPAAAEDLLPLIYDELRRLAAAKMAQENAGHTLQATALVHEAYLRLVEGQQQQKWECRGHFFAAAAEAMRRILVERARRRKRKKRGGDMFRQELVTDAIAAPNVDGDLLELDAALDSFEREHPRKAQLVKLRYFAGLTIPEAAAALGIGTTTADRDWAYARAWLYRQISRGVDPATD
jgi:RNA polymerase sigma factor (TIGR02999 family)